MSISVVIPDLSLNGVILLPEDRLPPAGILGMNIANHRLLKLLADDSRIGPLAIHSPYGSLREFRSNFEASELSDRVRVLVSNHDLEEFVADGSGVFFFPKPDIRVPLYLRQHTSAEGWAVGCLANSMGIPIVAESVKIMLKRESLPCDSMFCMSNAARLSIDRMAEEMGLEMSEAARNCFPVVPLGIDLELCLPISKQEARRSVDFPPQTETAVFVYFGRIDREYKADLAPLLKAFSMLESRENCRLVIAGACPRISSELEQLAFRASELRIAHLVEFRPNPTREDRHLLLSAADVFVSPVDSVQESFGISLLEAMSYRLPVIASDWSSYREIVVDGDTGILVRTWGIEAPFGRFEFVPTRNPHRTHWEMSQATSVDLRDLAASMDLLAQRPELGRAMGVRGRQRVESHFQGRRVVGQFCSEWESMIKRAKPTSPSESHVLTYNFGRVFRHYSSETIGPDTVIQAGKTDMLSSILQLPPEFLRPDLLMAIVVRCKTATRISELEGIGTENVRHVGYLLKHGQVKVLAEPD